jgi:hypothetical protein
VAVGFKVGLTTKYESFSGMISNSRQQVSGLKNPLGFETETAMEKKLGFLLLGILRPISV